MKNGNDFKPNSNQMKYLQVFLEAKDNVSNVKLAEIVGITPKTLWEWSLDDDYNKWFHEQVVKAMTHSLPKIYKGMEGRALKKYLDAKLYLRRFDKDFREKKELIAEYDIKLSDKMKKLSDEELDKIIDSETEQDKTKQDGGMADQGE